MPWSNAHESIISPSVSLGWALGHDLGTVSIIPRLVRPTGGHPSAVRRPPSAGGRSWKSMLSLSALYQEVATMPLLRLPHEKRVCTQKALKTSKHCGKIGMKLVEEYSHVSVFIHWVDKQVMKQLAGLSIYNSRQTFSVYINLDRTGVDRDCILRKSRCLVVFVLSCSYSETPRPGWISTSLCNTMTIVWNGEAAY